MVDKDQQDFDEFDTLVDDSVDPVDDFSFDQPDSSRKKRQTVFYLVLIFILVLGASSVWFVFLRQPDTNGSAPLPAPVAANPEASSDPQLADNNGLPPGVSPVEPNVDGNAAALSPENANIVPVDPNSVNPEVATPQIASPEVAAVENTAPANATVTSTGMTVEALPPPADAPPAPLQDNAAATPPTDVTTATPELTPTETAEVTPPSETSVPAPVEAPVAAPVVPEPTALAPAPALVPQEAVPAAPVAASAEVTQRLNQIEEQVKSLSSNAGAVVAGGGDTSALAEQIKELNDKLDRLNQQVESLDQRTTTFATELQNRSNDEPKAVHREPKPVAKKAAVKKAAPKPVAKSSGSSWELRSAQPGVAWLGKPGSGEMSRFAIGQTAPGLGTIQSVTQEGGRWIVKTSGGTLRQ